MIRIKNWKKYQHYKGRTPPWIKLHAALLDDYEFERLSDASKMQLIALWLLASRSRYYHLDGDPLLPHDEAYLTKKSGLKSKMDLGVLISSGFIVRYQSDSNLQASCKQLVPTDLDLDLETEKETPLAPHDGKAIVTVPPVTWDRTFSGITPAMTESWSKAYPACDIAQHLYRMDQWLLSNPAKAKKKNYYRFITNWLSKAQEKGGR